MPPEARFWAKVERTVGCWLWTASTIEGYGQFWDGTRRVLAHRWSLEQAGVVVPDGMEWTVDHRCRNHACARPSHLRVVTRGENVLMGIGLAARNKRKKKCSRGHDEWYIRPNGKRQCRACSRNDDRKRRGK